jgi:hypothetical protein
MADVIVYRVDGKDRVDFFNAEFLASARSNGLADPSTFYGSSIWDYFGDESTAEVYHAAYAKVRASRGRTLLAFRCDLADLRRTVQMELKWLDGDGIEHTCKTAVADKRPPLSLFDNKVERSESFVKLCSWCGQIQVFPRWVEPEEACRMFGNAPGVRLPQLTHGLCPECANKVAAQKRLAA